MGAMILAEFGNFSNFDSTGKILPMLVFHPPSTSRKPTNCYARMEKPVSKYLRYVIFNATTLPSMSALDIQHSLPTLLKADRRQALQCCHFPCRKKLVRLIYAMERAQQTYRLNIWSKQQPFHKSSLIVLCLFSRFGKWNILQYSFIWNLIFNS